MDDPRVEELRRREVVRNIPLMVVIGLILILGAFANFFTIVFYGWNRKRTVTNFLIATLAFNDLLACIIFWDEIAIILQSFTFQDLTGCRTVYFLNNWILVNSVLFLAVISVDRYKRICHPFTRQISFRGAWFIVLSVTMVTFCLTLREIFLADIVAKPVQMNDNSTVFGYFCVHTDDKSYRMLIKVSHLLNITIFLTAIVLMVVLYSLVIRKIVKARSLTIQSSVFNKDNMSTVVQSISTGTTDGEKSEITTTRRGSGMSEKCAGALDKPNGMPSNESGSRGPDDLTYCNSDVIGTEGHSGTKHNDSQLQQYSENNDDQEKSQPIGRTVYNNNQKTFKAERGVTKMVIAFTAVSILSFFPYFGTMIFGSRHVSTEDNLSNMGRKIARQFYMLNCVVNPYIMCYFNSRFRRFIRSFVCNRVCQLSE